MQQIGDSLTQRCEGSDATAERARNAVGHDLPRNAAACVIAKTHRQGIDIHKLDQRLSNLCKVDKTSLYQCILLDMSQRSADPYHPAFPQENAAKSRDWEQSQSLFCCPNAANRSLTETQFFADLRQFLHADYCKNRPIVDQTDGFHGFGSFLAICL